MSNLPKAKAVKTPTSLKKPPVPQSFWANFIQTLKDVFTDKGVLLMLIIAPIIYGFFLSMALFL